MGASYIKPTKKPGLYTTFHSFNKAVQLCTDKMQSTKLKWVAMMVQFLCITIALATAGGSRDCYIRFDDTGACACSYAMVGPNHPSCSGDSIIYIPSCYCMYYDSTQNLSIIGHCYFSCYNINNIHVEKTSSREFNADICDNFGYLNRTGRFCGRCSNTHGLAAYSYQYLKCIPCQDYGYKNWLRYFAVALLPLTAFYIFAVLLSFNVTSSSFNGVVLVIQCIMSPLLLTIAHDNFTDIPNHYYATLSVPLKVTTSIFCVVNLDFFRLVYPPFCLHPKANIFQILSLDYLYSGSLSLPPYLHVLCAGHCI